MKIKKGQKVVAIEKIEMTNDFIPPGTEGTIDYIYKRIMGGRIIEIIFDHGHKNKFPILWGLKDESLHKIAFLREEQEN